MMQGPKKFIKYIVYITSGALLSFFFVNQPETSSVDTFATTFTNVAEADDTGCSSCASDSSSDSGSDGDGDGDGDGGCSGG